MNIHALPQPLTLMAALPEKVKIVRRIDTDDGTKILDPIEPDMPETTKTLLREAAFYFRADDAPWLPNAIYQFETGTGETFYLQCIGIWDAVLGFKIS